jgi:hypothetical protein
LASFGFGWLWRLLALRLWVLRMAGMADGGRAGDMYVRMRSKRRKDRRPAKAKQSKAQSALAPPGARQPAELPSSLQSERKTSAPPGWRR